MSTYKNGNSSNNNGRVKGRDPIKLKREILKDQLIITFAATIVNTQQSLTSECVFE